MSFISLTFAIFMASVLAVYYLLPQRFRNALLLAASYAFYMYSSPLFAAYLAAVTLIGYFGALGISRAQNERGKNIASALSALAVIAGLLVFKYFDFFSSSFTALFSPEAQPILLGVGETNAGKHILYQGRIVRLVIAGDFARNGDVVILDKALRSHTAVFIMTETVCNNGIGDLVADFVGVSA